MLQVSNLFFPGGGPEPPCVTVFHGLCSSYYMFCGWSENLCEFWFNVCATTSRFRILELHFVLNKSRRSLDSCYCFSPLVLPWVSYWFSLWVWFFAANYWKGAHSRCFCPSLSSTQASYWLEKGCFLGGIVWNCTHTLVCTFNASKQKNVIRANRH